MALGGDAGTGGPRGPAAGPPGTPPGGRPPLRQAFVALEDRNYRFLWTSSASGFLGLNMQIVARGLLGWELTHSFGMVGVISLAFGLPQLLLLLVGGAVADRVDRRTLALYSQLATAAISFATGVLIATGLITVPLLIMFGIAQGTVFSFNMPAHRALVAEVVPRSQLMNAIALNNAAMNASRIVGPAIAGVVIGFWGIEAGYWGHTALYVVAAIMLSRLPVGTAHLESAEGRRGVVHEIGVGLRYVIASRHLRMLMLLAFIPTMFGMPYQQLLPGFVTGYLALPRSAFSLMLTVSGVGALLGSLAIAAFSEYPRKALIQLGAGIAAGVGLLMLSLASIQFGYAGALVSAAVLGTAFTLYQTVNNTLVMAETEPAYYGRVMSIYTLNMTMMPLMTAPAGFLGDAIGITNLFLIQGAIILGFLAIVVLSNPGYVASRVTALAAGPMPGRGPGAMPTGGGGGGSGG